MKKFEKHNSDLRRANKGKPKRLKKQFKNKKEMDDYNDKFVGREQEKPHRNYDGSLATKEEMAKGGKIADERIEKALQAYAVASLWTSINYDDYEEGEEQEFDAKYSVDDITPETMQSMKRDVKKFYEDNIDLINKSGLDDEQVGHDFWLTRHHHGTGFWDRDIPKEIGKKLTDASQKFKDYLLFAEDGKVKAEHLEKGGFFGFGSRPKSAINRDRKYQSQEEHEKRIST